MKKFINIKTLINGWTFVALIVLGFVAILKINPNRYDFVLINDSYPINNLIGIKKIITHDNKVEYHLFTKGEDEGDLTGLTFYTFDSTQPEIVPLANRTYMIRVLNPGSGGGADYRIFKLDESGKVTFFESNLGIDLIHSCTDPIKKDNTYTFKSRGSHCDWLDTGSGTPQTNIVTIN